MFGKNPEEKPTLMMGLRKSGRKFTELRKIDETAEHPLSSYPGFFGNEVVERPKSPGVTPPAEEDFNAGYETERESSKLFNKS